jgi:hypothetical protein
LPVPKTRFIICIPQLYNLDDDPAEQRNRWLEQPDVVARLTALLERYQAAGRSR